MVPSHSFLPYLLPWIIKKFKALTKLTGHENITQWVNVFSNAVIKTFDDNMHDNMITMMIICIMVSSHLFPPLLMALHNRYIQSPHKTYKTLELTENLSFEQRLKKITWILSNVFL